VQVLPALLIGDCLGELPLGDLDQVAQVERPDARYAFAARRQELGAVWAERDA
jgi:hypothetical protein